MQTDYLGARPSLALRVKSISSMIVLTAFCLLMLIPLWWVVVTSLLPASEIYSTSQTLWPTSVTFENFVELLTETGFLRSMANSTIVAVAVTVVGTLFSLGAGYAFAKLRFPGRNLMFSILVGSMVIPGVVTILPNFILIGRLGLLDTLWAIILPSLALPFAMLWMRQYIQTAVPDSMIDAARIDGCSEYRIMWSIVGPVVGPGLAGVAVWLFLSSWNAFFGPLIYLNSNDNYTYPVFLAALQANPIQQTMHLVIAASVLSMLPIIVLYLFLQRYFQASAALSIDKG